MVPYDAIVLGAGGVGSAAMYHLARRGLRVLGLDRFSGGHDRGSSHGQTRIIRQAYFEHSDYVPLLRRAYTLWDDVEQQTEEKLFHQVGLLEIGPADGVVVPGVLDSASRHELHVERLDRAAVARRFPGFRLPDDCEAVFEPTAGFLMVERCVLAHLRLAAALGAEHRTGETVTSWSPVGGDVRVQTDEGQYFAKRLVVAAGSWSGQLLRDLGVKLRVLRKSLHWFASDDRHYQASHECPTFFYEACGGYFYGFPGIDELGVKVAEHSGGTEVDDPLLDDRHEEAEDVARTTEFLKQHLPGVSSQRTKHDVCFYTQTPDEHFIVDRHPECEEVVFAAGLSGHGFKFTSVLGEVLADLAVDGKTSAPIEFLRLTR